MNGMAEPGIKYRRLSERDKAKLLEGLREKIEGDGEVVFAYVHGGFVEASSFRDVDLAIWIKDSSKAFHYTVDFSVKLEIEVGIPIDVQVLNEAPLPFKYHVFTRGKMLFSRDESLRLKLVDETVRQYVDVKLLIEKSRV